MKFIKSVSILQNTQSSLFLLEGQPEEFCRRIQSEMKPRWTETAYTGGQPVVRPKKLSDLESALADSPSTCMFRLNLHHDTVRLTLDFTTGTLYVTCSSVAIALIVARLQQLDRTNIT